MRKIILLVLILVLQFPTFGQVIDGVYEVNLEKCWIDSMNVKRCYEGNNPENIWYDNYLVSIEGDSIFVDTSPFYISSNGDTSHSSSDGGFFYYSGIIKETKSKKYRAELKEIFCDYCGVKAVVDNNNVESTERRTKLLEIQIKRGKVYIEGKLASETVLEYPLQSKTRKK